MSEQEAESRSACKIKKNTEWFPTCKDDPEARLYEFEDGLFEVVIPESFAMKLDEDAAKKRHEFATPQDFVDAVKRLPNPAYGRKIFHLDVPSPQSPNQFRCEGAITFCRQKKDSSIFDTALKLWSEAIGDSASYPRSHNIYILAYQIENGVKLERYTPEFIIPFAKDVARFASAKDPASLIDWAKQSPLTAAAAGLALQTFAKKAPEEILDMQMDSLQKEVLPAARKALLNAMLPLSDAEIGKGLPVRLLIYFGTASEFESLKHLKTLDLSQNDYGDAMLSALSPLVNLEELNLSDNSFASLRGKVFSSFRQLRKLTLQQMRLEWEAFEELVHLEHLTELDLSYTRFEEPSAVSLAFIPSLKKLTLAGCRLSDAAVASLRGLISENCQIIWD